MAYDPNDPADKEIVDGLIAEATQRLQSKNQELIGEIRDLRKGKGDPDKLEKLERQLEENQTQLDTLKREKTTLETKLTKATETGAAAAKRADSLEVSTAMAKAMTENKIAPQFHEAVQAMFAGKASVKEVNGEYQVLVGDKPLSDTLKEFAGSDNGKHFVAAANNGGGGSGGDGGADGAGKKTMSRSAFDALSPDEKVSTSKEGVIIT